MQSFPPLKLRAICILKYIRQLVTCIPQNISNRALLPSLITLLRVNRQENQSHKLRPFNESLTN